MRRIKKVLILSILIVLSLACVSNTPLSTPQNSSASDAQAEESEPDKLKDLCPQFDDILPDGWERNRHQLLDITGDDKKECILFYNYDHTSGDLNSDIINGVVFHLTDTRPPSIIAYNLTLPEGKYLCEHTCTARMDDILSGWEGEELLIEDKNSENITVHLSIFHWDAEGESNGAYQALGYFPGDAISCSESKPNLIEVKTRMEVPPTLANRATYYAHEQKTFYGDNLPNPTQDIVFWDPALLKADIEDITSRPYPEMMVLAFYRHYNTPEKVQQFFTTERWEALGQCTKDQCGCEPNVSFVQVTNLSTDPENINPNVTEAKVATSIICETESCKPNCPGSTITWHLTRVGDHWKLERLDHME